MFSQTGAFTMHKRIGGFTRYILTHYSVLGAATLPLDAFLLVLRIAAVVAGTAIVLVAGNAGLAAHLPPLTEIK